jgi:hypothetical protein
MEHRSSSIIITPEIAKMLLENSLDKTTAEYVKKWYKG